MRKKRRSTALLCLALLILCAGLTAAYTVLFIWRDDTTPPVIAMAEDILEVSVSASDDELLAGVTATDNRDGDVTDSLLVQGVSNLADGVVTVTYAAFDAAGNVAKAARSLRYTDYEQPRFDLYAPLVYNASTAVDVLGRICATDLRDGDISGRIKADLVSNTSSLAYPGTHEVQFRVTNSLGDTAYMTLPVDVLPSGDYNATVLLKDYLIYLPKDREFNARSYLQGLDIGLSRDPVEDQEELSIQVDSNVRSSVPGVYSACYTVTYVRGVMEYVGYSRLIVVVEE